MNYCTKCGTKLEKNDKFCAKCGTKVDNSVPVKTSKVKKEGNTEKFILMLGVFLVLFSSFALGIILWEGMGNIFKIGFFVFECLLFFTLSFVLKKVKSKVNRVFFIIGLVLIPYTLCLIPYYQMLPNYFINGPGLYVYLAIIFFVTFILYILVNLAFKSKVVEYLSLISLFIAFVSTGLIFSEDSVITILLVMVYIFIINLISNTDKFNLSIKKSLSITSAILLLLVTPFVLGVTHNKYESYNIFINLITVFLYMITTYIRIGKNPKSIFRGFAPFTLPLVACNYMGALLVNYNNFEIYGIALIATIIYFISILFNSKLFSVMSLVITYIILLFFMLVAMIIGNYQMLLVLSVIVLVLNLSNMILFKYKFCDYVLPINLFILIYSLVRCFIEFKFVYVLIISSIVFIGVYIVLKLLKKKISFAYILTALILAFFSIYRMDGTVSIINISIVLLFVIIFALSKINKENTAFSIITYILLNVACIHLFGFYDNLYNMYGSGLYNGLLLISGSTLIVSLLINLIKKFDLKPYILYSEIVILIITLFNSMNHPSYVLFLNIVLFALSYLSLIKFHNVKWYRIIYIMVGLFTINRIIFTVINPVVIASIISIVTILIILVIMYLLEIENNIMLTVISLIILIPYYTLISSEGYINELYTLPLIIYTFVFTEVIKFKSETAKKLWTIIPISVLSYFFLLANNGTGSIIFDIVLSLLYIFIGLYRKYNYLIYFGIIFIIVTIFIQLFTILNSMAVVILLIVIGFILIGIVLFNELRKK